VKEGKKCGLEEENEWRKMKGKRRWAEDESGKS
jgi:hypothetical protein